jgi:hypothetical protein
VDDFEPAIHQARRSLANLTSFAVNHSQQENEHHLHLAMAKLGRAAEKASPDQTEQGQEGYHLAGYVFQQEAFQPESRGTQYPESMPYLRLVHPSH